MNGLRVNSTGLSCNGNSFRAGGCVPSYLFEYLLNNFII